MSYTPTVWNTGDTITAQKLNHMEDGIATGGGRFLVTFTYDDDNDSYSSDKTFAETYAAIEAGMYVVAYDTANSFYLYLDQVFPVGEEEGSICFNRTRCSGSEVKTSSLYLISDDSVYSMTYQYPST